MPTTCFVHAAIKNGRPFAVMLMLMLVSPLFPAGERPVPSGPPGRNALALPSPSSIHIDRRTVPWVVGPRMALMWYLCPHRADRPTTVTTGAPWPAYHSSNQGLRTHVGAMSKETKGEKGAATRDILRQIIHNHNHNLLGLIDSWSLIVVHWSRHVLLVILFPVAS